MIRACILACAGVRKLQYPNTFPPLPTFLPQPFVLSSPPTRASNSSDLLLAARRRVIELLQFQTRAQLRGVVVSRSRVGSVKSLPLYAPTAAHTGGRQTELLLSRIPQKRISASTVTLGSGSILRSFTSALSAPPAASTATSASVSTTTTTTTTTSRTSSRAASAVDRTTHREKPERMYDAKEHSELRYLLHKRLNHFLTSGDFEAAAKVLDSFKILGVTFSPTTYIIALNIGMRKQDSPRVLELLKLTHQKGALLSPPVLNDVIVFLAGHSHLFQAVQLLNESLSKNVVIQRATFRRVINNLAEVLMLDQAHSLFLSMRNYYPPCAYLYCKLIKACALQDPPRVDFGFQLFDDMKKANIAPNSYVCTSLLMLCGRQGLHDKALQVFEDMLNAGIEPTAVTYSLLVDTLARGGQLSSALEIVQRLAPTCIMLTSLINACTGLGEFELASQLVKKLLACRDLDLIACTSMIKLFISHKQYDKAIQFFGEIRGQIPLDEVVYGLVVHAMLKHNTESLSPALALFDEMKALGVPPSRQPNALFYQSFITAAARRGDESCAIRLYSEMQELQVKPNLTTLIAMLDACGTHSPKTRDSIRSSLHMVNRIYSEIVELVVPNLSTWRAIILSMCRCDDFSRAFLLLERVLRTPTTPPTITTSSSTSTTASTGGDSSILISSSLDPSLLSLSSSPSATTSSSSSSSSSSAAAAVADLSSSDALAGASAADSFSASSFSSSSNPVVSARRSGNISQHRSLHVVTPSILAEEFLFECRRRRRMQFAERCFQLLLSLNIPLSESTRRRFDAPLKPRRT